MRRVLVLVAGLAAALALAGPARAQAEDVPVEDQVVLTGTVQVPRGRSVGDVVVFDGRAVVAGVVRGDVVVLSGTATIAGQVAGDVVVIDGSVTLRASAQVSGDVISGGELTIEPGAQVGGDATRFVNVSLARPLEVLGALLGPLAIAFSSLLFGLLVWLLAPRGADRVAEATRTAPLAATGLGLAAWILVPVLAALVTVTILGIPAGLSILLGLGLLGGIGYAMAVWSLGRALVPVPRSRAGAFFAGWGISVVIGLVPFLNVAWWIVATIVGLGGTIVAAWRARGEGRHRRRGPSPAPPRPVVPPSVAPPPVPGDAPPPATDAPPPADAG